MGQTHPSGRASKEVPGGMPLRGSPTAGSYTYPQFVQMYLPMDPPSADCLYPYHTAKYFAWGWCATIADVVCSGTISIDSVSVTPIFSGRRSANTSR